MSALWVVVLVGSLSAFAFWLLAPLRRALKRASSLLDAKTIRQFEESDDPHLSEEGEWQDLEIFLEQARREIISQSKRLQQEEAEIRGLMTAVPQPIVAIDQNRRVLFFNPLFAEFAGIHKAGSRRLLLAELVRIPQILEAFETVLNTNEHFNTDLAVTSADNETDRHYRLSVAPLRLAQNSQAQGAVGALIDVTELKLAEKVRIEFVGNVSHELRTPLTAIQGYSQVLEQDLRALPGAEILAGFAARIKRNVDRLRELVDDLLDLSSLESRVGLKKDLVDIRDITEAAIQQVQGRAKEKQQEIVAQIEIEALHADRARVEQVLINLVDNASKYIPEGKRIEVRWKPGPSSVVLEVADNGPGIAAVHRERLFERFYRVDESRSRESGGGSGLGLAIVKHILDAHGGHVRVESALGTGTTFICEFPA